MKKLKRICMLVLDDIMMVYPYLLLFYVVSLAATFYFKDWTHIFYWSGFTAIIVALGLVFAIRQWRKWSKWGLVVKRIRIQDCTKAGIMLLLITYLGMEHAGFLDMVICLYMLIVLLFDRGIRMSSVIAFLLLLSCPVLLWLPVPDQIAINAAVYGYYFLIICLVGHIRQYLSTHMALFH